MANKKKFIKIEIPILNESLMALGNTETLNGKTIRLDLSRKLRGRNLEIVFTLKKVENKIIGYPKRLELMKQYLIRMMRKRASYVEDSFEAECKDIPCRIKPFLITRKRVSRAIRQNLRKTTREFLTDFVSDKSYLQFCESTLYGEIQKEMLIKLKKIYPLSFCEIRILETKKLDEADLTIKEKKIKAEFTVEEETLEKKIEKEIIEEKPEKIIERKNSENEEQ